MNARLAKALNAQMNYELGASYAYLAMAAYFDTTSLKGMASWMHKQSSEERDHARKIYEHLLDCGQDVNFTQLAAPNQKFTGVKDVFTKALKLEQSNTANINKLYEQSLTAKHYPTQVLLQWFITEQVEEEATCQEILDLLAMAGDKGAALFALDAKLGGRQ
jgi:ferritin